MFKTYNLRQCIRATVVLKTEHYLSMAGGRSLPAGIMMEEVTSKLSFH